MNDEETKQLAYERDAVQIDTTEALNYQSSQLQGSRKNNTRQGKRMYKNLGAAGKYLDADDNQEIRGQEKVQFVKRGGDRHAKDKAKVKYNYKDFLNKFENLSEQCIFLVEHLAQGSSECMICQNPIY